MLWGEEPVINHFKRQQKYSNQDKTAETILIKWGSFCKNFNSTNNFMIYIVNFDDTAAVFEEDCVQFFLVYKLFLNTHDRKNYEQRREIKRKYTLQDI